MFAWFMCSVLSTLCWLFPRCANLPNKNIQKLLKNKNLQQSVHKLHRVDWIRLSFTASFRINSSQWENRQHRGTYIQSEQHSGNLVTMSWIGFFVKDSLNFRFILPIFHYKYTKTSMSVEITNSLSEPMIHKFQISMLVILSFGKPQRATVDISCLDLSHDLWYWCTDQQSCGCS